MVVLSGVVKASPDGVVSGLVEDSSGVRLSGVLVVSRVVEFPLGVVVAPEGL